MDHLHLFLLYPYLSLGVQLINATPILGSHISLSEIRAKQSNASESLIDYEERCEMPKRFLQR